MLAGQKLLEAWAPTTREEALRVIDRLARLQHRRGGDLYQYQQRHRDEALKFLNRFERQI